MCSDTQTCEGCSAHSDCAASDVCLPSGACAAAAEVAYVAPTGTDNAQCTQAMPCTEIAKALMTNRPYLKLSGETTEQVTITGKTVTLLAAPGAKLTDTSNGTLLTISGASNVSIYDLEISGASGAAGVGIAMPLGTTATVTLDRATVRGNANAGVAMSGGTLAVTDAIISGNQGAGISFAGGTLTVTRSTLAENAGGGLSMSADGMITLTHNFIYRNGNTTSASAGGARLQPMTGSKIEFNTVVDNQANQNSASAGGWFCDTTGFTTSGNLVFRNIGGPAGMTQTFGSCAPGNSFIQAASIGDNTPMFVSPNITPFDYHLTAATPTSIRDAAGACTGVDVDGQPRPAGAACDLGADEHVP